jgi:hypothetical protein
MPFIAAPEACLGVKERIFWYFHGRFPASDTCENDLWVITSSISIDKDLSLISRRAKAADKLAMWYQMASLQIGIEI